MPSSVCTALPNRHRVYLFRAGISSLAALQISNVYSSGKAAFRKVVE